jgi:DNA invertase Pin-like site-specific DNA recombinase
MDTFDNTTYDDAVALFQRLRRCAVRSSQPSPIAYSYLRFSSPEQAEGDSVRRQTALRDGWLKRHPEVRLDTKLVDSGVSGYRGEHRTNRKHALASFLDLVERGRVPAGSYLIVENLDRLTRENPVVSIPAVLGLIGAGIRVVQLSPVEMVYDGEMEQHHLMNMLWELARGHGESKRKSDLIGPAWREKKDEARQKKTPHGKACPGWLELVDGKYRVREDAGRAVRLIFKWAAEGLGIMATVQRLNAEGVPSFTNGGGWHKSYVSKILNNPATMSVYQPKRGHRNRVADGDPVPGYFPAVVTEAEFYAARSAATSRDRRCGRPGGRKRDHPFSGMLHCAVHRCPLHAVTRRGRKYLVSARAENGDTSCPWRSFPLEVFNAEVLLRLRELQASDLFADPGAARLAELDGRLADVEKRIAVAVARFEADPESPTWADRVSRYDIEKRALVRELAEARREAASPLSETWAEAVRLMAAEEPDRLRAALLATVAEVWCVFVRRDHVRLAAVQVHFQGGAHRDYLIYFRQASHGRKAEAGARDFADTDLADGALDLRDPKAAARLAGVLEAMELPTDL